ncbi:hypothetical protein TBS_10450 [Thermobispora bispora]|uniref:Hemerythrin HHE cation binding domain protein n=1 Tax=Thermobispora bispora (strain ATCC 19993 / DSM 43833 / CBS 139.67 / JCM 10125 / KCTC 9307 / NBRC 14880 / R51) TaxID=469371 RepID=D6Y1Z0_THEBD|nr:hemerythrin domain-containing protein [Thermobispora bispora]MBO2474518.1 hemerythrin domain-containing protein [Actinomycetales bacterium]MDI9580918.1 hemerythrin domain-containing protein [Thermobispora sp.]ADG88746.1 Hemerythrin HHE cation binding domain protein [Thermobispora bispora DSM 43833]MBX6169479.1 hemerythrin domain-containing protein [Thermobispora bispora]QSI48516.1 hemerythrin domain-containing protein [Thermobispora bispora]
MGNRPHRLDMTMMYAVHDALRREAEHIARLSARAGDDPWRVLRTAAGWEMFKAYLRVHHTTEDDVLWPAMHEALTERPDGLALLEVMEAEHAAIDPLLRGIDAALADRDRGPELLGGLTDALATLLHRHLKHEEDEALPLIDATLTEGHWRRFGDEHRTRIGADARRYLPWVLDGASPERVAAVLGRLPEELRAAYADEWRPAYARLDRWGAGVSA